MRRRRDTTPRAPNEWVPRTMSLAGRGAAPGRFLRLAKTPQTRHIPPAGDRLPVIHTRGAFPGPPGPVSRDKPPRRLNRTLERTRPHGDARIHPAPAARSRRPLRPPHPPLESPDGAVPLRRAQPGAHHRPAADRPAAGSRVARHPRHHRRRRPCAAGRHQARRRRVRRRCRQTLRPGPTSTTAG